MIKGTGKAYRRAKQLRREMTLPEILLWQQLRKHQTGLHWRKQHPAGPYDLDFYCDKAKLCVEVDGEAHERGDQPRKDAVRDAFLAKHGVFTLRIAAVDVLKNLEGVLVHIVDTARSRIPPPAQQGEVAAKPTEGREQSERSTVTGIATAAERGGPSALRAPPPRCAGEE